MEKSAWRYYVWVFIAGALLGDRWAWWGMLAVVAIEALMTYLDGMWLAHQAAKRQTGDGP